MFDKKHDVDFGWLIVLFLLGVYVGLMIAFVVVSDGDTCDSETVCVPALSVERLNECIDVYVMRGDELVSARLCERGLYSGE